jgi:hypothetical protein
VCIIALLDGREEEKVAEKVELLGKVVRNK